MVKKTLSTFLAVILTISIALGFTACGGPFDETFEKDLRSDVYDIYEELKLVYDDANSTAEVFAWLENWGEVNDFYVNRTSDDSLILRKPSTEGYSDAPSSTIQCPVSLQQTRNRCVESAIAMAVACSAPDHGALTLMFTGRTNGELNGVTAIPKRYIKRSDNLINLCYSGHSSLFTAGAATSRYRISDELSKTPSSATNGYKITIKGMQTGDTGDRSYISSNPIRVLGDFLSGCISRGMYLELISFESDAPAGYYPTSATLEVAVSNGDNKSFLSRLESAIENFSENNSDENEDSEFSYSSIDVPSQVFSSESTSSITGLMYTLQEGIYAYEDEEENGTPVAVQNTFSISTSGGKLKMGIVGRSLEPDVLRDMDNSIEQTCYLNDVAFDIVYTSSLWSREYNNPLADSLRVATSQNDLDLEPSSSFMETECGYFQAVSPNLDIVSLGVNIDDMYEFTISLISYMQSLGTPSQTLDTVE